MIYLDYNATAPLRAEVREAMLPYLGEEFGNASSVHRLGARARAAYENARRTIAERLGAQAAEILFTSGGTESNNLAIFGTVRRHARAHVVASAIEHSSVALPIRELARAGASVTWLGVDHEGRVRPDALRAVLRPETRLVSIVWANNEIGSVQPIAELSAICRDAGVLLHADAVQALGKIPVDTGCLDLCSFSAHKLGGPKGIGALFVRKGVQLDPLMFGGGQERNLRPGTENVAAAVGFAAAMRAAAHDGDTTGASVAALREKMWQGIAELGDVVRNSPVEGCLPNTLNVSFTGLRGDAVVAALDLEGVAVSTGSACTAGAGEASHVLLALGRSDAEARGGVRFSLGPSTTAEEIDRAIEIVRTVITRMRSVARRVVHG